MISILIHTITNLLEFGKKESTFFSLFYVNNIILISLIIGNTSPPELKKK